MTGANTTQPIEPTTTTSAQPSTDAEVVVPDYLQTLLEEIAVREGFVDYTIDTESGSNVGDGFQAVMLRTKITGTRNGQSDQQLDLICKIPPIAEIRRQLGATSFIQEIFAYETMLPRLSELQAARNVAREDGFFSFPKCYGSFSNKATNDFAIVLEDLRESGCRMWNKMDEMDFAHAKLILRQIGRFHALSFALRDQQPDVLREFADRPSGMYKAMTDFPMAHEFYLKAFGKTLDVLVSEKDADAKANFTLLRDNYREVMKEVCDGKNSEPFTVLNHGDCWNNNVMFRYASVESRDVQSVVVIDWQMGQYCSPATDLSYFLYSSTEQRLRDEHFDDLLHEYHDSLSVLLRKLGSDPDKLFTFDDLQREMQQYAIYAQVLAPMLVQVVTVDPKDIPDMDKIDFENVDDFEFMPGSTDKYTKRMRDVVRDATDRGYFKTKWLKQ